LQNDYETRLHALKLVEHPSPTIRRPRDIFAIVLFARLEGGAFVMGPVLRRANARRGVADSFPDRLRTFLARALQGWNHDMTLFAVKSQKGADDSKYLMSSGFAEICTTDDPFVVSAVDEICDLFGDQSIYMEDGARLLVRYPRRSVVVADQGAATGR